MDDAPAPAPESVLGLDPRALLARAVRRADRPRVGDYELLERIAEGGMGVVHRARQISLQRIVAVKMIRSGLLATPSEVQRFQREAKAAASLDHPHIVPIYEIGEDEGRHFFSMKLIEGGNLADRSAGCDAAHRRSAAWVRNVAGTVAAMARAVHHAHERGLLHRDVKPTNVLLDEPGDPHLTDFGLAKLLERDIGLTQTLAVMGTPSYMAPEQAAGHSSRLTVAADVYSLGAVLSELPTGSPPFAGDSTLELLRQVQEREPPSIRKSNPGLSRDLETICFKCLEKEPPRRCGTAETMAADLERWLADQPILARPVGLWERSWLWLRRNLIAALALSDLGPPQTWHAAIPRQFVHQRMLTADGERYALFGDETGITVYRRSDGPPISELATPPDHLFVGLLSPDGRYLMDWDRARPIFAWDLSRPGRGPHTPMLGLPGSWEFYPAFTSDSRSLALLGGDRRVRFFDLASGEERASIDLPFTAQRVVVSPAADQLVLASGGTVWIWNIRPAAQVQSHQHRAPVTSLAWHPAGRFVAVGHANGESQMLDGVSGASRWLTPHRQEVGVTFDPRGEFVATGRGTERV